jgi:hypothetical protein
LPPPPQKKIAKEGGMILKRKKKRVLVMPFTLESPNICESYDLPHSIMIKHHILAAILWNSTVYDKK